VALIGLSVLGELSWWVTVLIISREVGVTIIRFVVLKHGVIPASRGGKAKTMFQMLAIVLFLLPITPDMTLLWWIRIAAMGIAFALTMLTGIDYVDKAYRTRRNSKADRATRAAAGDVGSSARSDGTPAADEPGHTS
jgi:CDP-diacylglycerol--glycerol-3-phosphate 3-phosphatidyltransferase